MDKWEYDFVIVMDTDNVQTLVLLDQKGAEGWEFTGHVSDTGYGMSYLMKRKIQGEGEAL